MRTAEVAANSAAFTRCFRRSTANRTTAAAPTAITASRSTAGRCAASPSQTATKTRAPARHQSGKSGSRYCGQGTGTTNQPAERNSAAPPITAEAGSVSVSERAARRRARTPRRPSAKVAGFWTRNCSVKRHADSSRGQPRGPTTTCSTNAPAAPWSASTPTTRSAGKAAPAATTSASAPTMRSRTPRRSWKNASPTPAPRAPNASLGVSMSPRPSESPAARMRLRDAIRVPERSK